MSQRDRQQRRRAELDKARRRRERALQRADGPIWRAMHRTAVSILKGAMRASPRGARGRFVVQCGYWQNPQEYRAYCDLLLRVGDRHIPQLTDWGSAQVTEIEDEVELLPRGHTVFFFWTSRTGLVTRQGPNSGLEFCDQEAWFLTFEEVLDEVGISGGLYHKLRLSGKPIEPSLTTTKGYFFAPKKVAEIKEVVANYQKWGPELRATGDRDA